MKTLQIILILLVSTIATSQNSFQPTVDVAGEGIVRVVPDEVTINVQVENKGENPKELKKENDRIVNDVLVFIKSLKIKESDTKTQYIRLNKNFDYQSKTYHYVANQSISVKLKDLSKYESLMNGLLESGINRIDGISFSVSNKEELQSEARIKAVQDAKKKAMEYAGVLDQSIGKAISISEFSNNIVPNPMNRKISMAMSSDSAGANQQTISLGEIEIRSNVNVSFILD